MGIQSLEEADFGQISLFWGIITLLSSHQEDKVQLFKSEPRRGAKNSIAGKDGGNEIHWGKRNSYGTTFLKTQITKWWLQSRDGGTKIQFYGVKKFWIFAFLQWQGWFMCIYSVFSTSFWLHCSHRLNWIQFISPLVWEIHLEPHPKHDETMKIHFWDMNKSLYVCF